MLDGLPPSTQGHHWPHGITIVTPERRFLLACETESEQRAWMEVFRKVVDRPMLPQEYAGEVGGVAWGPSPMARSSRDRVGPCPFSSGSPLQAQTLTRDGPGGLRTPDSPDVAGEAVAAAGGRRDPAAPDVARWGLSFSR